MVANGMEILTFLIQGVFAQGFTLLVRTCAFFRNCGFSCVVQCWLGMRDMETHSHRNMETLYTTYTGRHTDTHGSTNFVLPCVSVCLPVYVV